MSDRLVLAFLLFILVDAQVASAARCGVGCCVLQGAGCCMVRFLCPHLDCVARLYEAVRCSGSSLIQVLPLSQRMTLPSSLSVPMCKCVHSSPKQALQFGLQVKDWKLAQVSLLIVAMVLALVDHLPLKCW